MPYYGSNFYNRGYSFNRWRGGGRTPRIAPYTPVPVRFGLAANIGQFRQGMRNRRRRRSVRWYDNEYWSRRRYAQTARATLRAAQAAANPDDPSNIDTVDDSTIPLGGPNYRPTAANMAAFHAELEAHRLRARAMQEQEDPTGNRVIPGGMFDRMGVAHLPGNSFNTTGSTEDTTF